MRDANLHIYELLSYIWELKRSSDASCYPSCGKTCLRTDEAFWSENRKLDGGRASVDIFTLWPQGTKHSNRVTVDTQERPSDQSPTTCSSISKKYLGICVSPSGFLRTHRLTSRASTARSTRPQQDGTDNNTKRGGGGRGGVGRGGEEEEKRKPAAEDDGGGVVVGFPTNEK